MRFSDVPVDSPVNEEVPCRSTLAAGRDPGPTAAVRWSKRLPQLVVTSSMSMQGQFVPQDFEATLRWVAMWSDFA